MIAQASSFLGPPEELPDPKRAYPTQGDAAASRKAAVLARMGPVSCVRETIGPRPKLTNSAPQSGEKSSTHTHRRWTNPWGSIREAAPAMMPPAIEVQRVK